MKIEVHRDVTMEELEAALQQALTGRNVKIKREKDRLDVSLNSIQGAVIRLKTADNMTKMEVTPHTPIAGTFEIISLIAACIMYQTCGRICGIPAIIVAVGWPFLLGHIVSRAIASECVAILSKTVQP